MVQKGASKYTETNESYTSQKYSTYRTIDNQQKTQRHLYVCKKCGNVLNADTNTAITILRKVVPDVPLRNSGTVDIPIRIRTLDVKLLKLFQ